MDITEKKILGMTFYEYNGSTYDSRRAAEDAKRANEARNQRDLERAQAKADEANKRLEAARAKVNPTTPDAMAGESRYQTPDVASMSDEDLVAKRNEAEGEAKKIFQDEINKRNSDGQEHSWTAADKALSERKATAAAAQKAAEENPVEVQKAEEMQSKMSDAADEQELANSELGQALESEGVTEEKPEDKKKDKKDSAWTKYWKNIAYGNDNGSTKDEANKAEKDRKYEEFLTKDPSLIKAIFSKDSGLNLGQRAIRLGELLSTLAGNTFAGAYAGFNRQALPQATQGKYAQIYNNALTGQYNRTQEQFSEQQKVKNEVKKVTERFKQMPAFAGMSDDVLNKMGTSALNGETVTEEEAASRWWPNATTEEAKLYYDAYKTVMAANKEGRTNKSENMDVKAKELNLQSTTIKNAIDNARNANELKAQITAIDSNIRNLEEIKKQLAKEDQTSYFEYINNYLGYLSGIQTEGTGSEAGRSSGVSASASVRGGIPVVSGSVTGGAEHSWNSAERQSMQTDLLRYANIDTAKSGAKNWKEFMQEYSSQISSSIDAQIEDCKSQKAYAEARLRQYESETGIDDGIVKAPHMKQWLVREDGTKIELNPSDNIYATKNDLTTENDEGQDVVPMEKEDPVVVIQRKLGHNGGQINKSFEYYLEKLRG